MSRYRYLFLVMSSVVAVAVLGAVWRHLGTHLPWGDALQYGRIGPSVRDVGLWGGFVGSHYRTFGFPLHLSLFGGELSPDTVWGTTSGSLFVGNIVLFLLAAWFFVISAAKIDRRFFFPLAAGVLLNPFVLVYVPHVLTESLSIIVALAAAGCFVRLVEKGDRYGSLFLCAVLAGYLMEVRPANLGISLAFLIGILTVFFYHSRRAAVSKRQLLLAATVLFVGFVLPIGIQVSINWVVHADPTPFSIADLGKQQLWRGTYELKHGPKGLRYVSPWLADVYAFKGAVLSFYVDHPWTALRTCFVHLYVAVNHDFFGVYVHEPKYVKYNWHQLLSSTIQYFGVIGGVATLLSRRRRRRSAHSDLLILLGWLVVIFSAAIVALSAVETRYGYAMFVVLSFSAVAWLLASSRRSLLTNGAGFAGLALYLFLSAELNGWIAGHAVPRIPGAPAVEVPASISALRERHKYEMLVSRYREEGQIDKALELCESEAQRDLNETESCVDARVYLALALKSEGKTVEAITELNTVVELAPDRARPWRILADIHRERGEEQEASRFYQQALRVDPVDLVARVHLALVYGKLGRSEEAVEELKVASRLYPKRSWPVQALANIYRVRGEEQEASRLYQRALRIDPLDLVARVHLALVYRNLGRFERAIEELKTASSHAPDKSWPLRVLADIYRKMGEEKLALAHCRKAIQVEPEDIHAGFLLGRIYEQDGKQEEAIRAYRDVLAIDPDSRLAKAALSRLRK